MNNIPSLLLVGNIQTPSEAVSHFLRERLAQSTPHLTMLMGTMFADEALRKKWSRRAFRVETIAPDELPAYVQQETLAPLVVAGADPVAMTSALRPYTAALKAIATRSMLVGIQAGAQALTGGNHLQTEVEKRCSMAASTNKLRSDGLGIIPLHFVHQRSDSNAPLHATEKDIRMAMQKIAPTRLDHARFGALAQDGAAVFVEDTSADAHHPGLSAEALGTASFCRRVVARPLVGGWSTQRQVPVDRQFELVRGPVLG